MKNTKIKIILSVIICLSVAGFAGTVEAASSLYVSPAASTKTAGDIFTASVGFSASGSKVCAVEGTLVFNGLSCQSITVASDVMAQSSPTCSNPHFLIGIPNCATSDKALLTVSVKAGSAGIASINATGVDIIGEGASVGSASTGGSYTINAVPIPVLTPTPTQQVTQSVEEITPEVTTPAEQVAPENNIPTGVGAAAGAAALANTGASAWFNWILIIVVILLVIYGIYYLVKRKKK